MKNNQFAIRPTDLTTAKTELRRIQFLSASNDAISDPIDLWHDLLIRAMPQIHGQSARSQQLQNIMATPSLTLADYLIQSDQLSQTAFYAVALQLLHFQVGLDFDLENPMAAIKKIGLPALEAPLTFSRDHLLSAWYLLLCTHNKLGQTYLDDLTAEGYFFPFYHDETVSKPLLFNGKAQAVFDPHQLRYDVVYVESPQDTDHDGQRDLLKVKVIRPVETETGLTVPVLYTASPYGEGTNDEAGEQLTHEVNVPLEHKVPNQLTLSDVTYREAEPTLPPERQVTDQVNEPEENFARVQSYTLNDYFLARGFAVVYAAGIGTKDSDGIRTTGDPEETISTVAVIEWLDGKRRAFTNKTDNVEIKAWWSNHHIAMTGRSYLGTLATAAATTGVSGLKTVISEAAISSWYDYYRENGLVIAPGGFQGEDADVLAEETFSRQLNAGDYHRIKSTWAQQLTALTRDQDRQTGNYSSFWDARNYLNQVPKIKCDMILVHGLNDWNVKPKNVAQLWDALRDVPVEKKLILHQGQHVYINAFRSIDFTDMMNLWLTHKLLDVDNQAETTLPNVIVQDNTVAESWHAYPDWGSSTNPTETWYLGAGTLESVAKSTVPVQFNDQLPDHLFDFYTHHVDQWHTDTLANDSQMAGHRLLFKTEPLTEDRLIDGSAVVHLSVAVNDNKGMLSVALVDFGSAHRLGDSPTVLSRNSLNAGFRWREDDLREFQPAPVTPSKMITKAHMNLQNRHHAYQVDDLTPNQPVQVDLKLQPTFFKVKAGHQLGLVVYATDMGMTIRGNQALVYTLDPGKSKLTLPLHP
ncbi:Xaa-Pro dipeptidyl-peptidase [Levilactobacillus bambusae]|uniref:Xaa-Pro dipeptidyl-peptidase n=1 Tax=Levilactobacillus bambusae TaxID=2024736 RepID=A0A2V1MYK3_9LACO|nr:Xaa-Pro dipeptidyl-peptidase [Levilactobacillus bambusae]PWG00047.1 Xaa-Pro dipeptidyl-peptidase [Levilactobacillus bambusae]